MTASKKKRKVNKKSLANIQEGKCRFRDKELASRAGKKGAAKQKEMKTLRETYAHILSLKSPKTIEDKLKQLMPDLPPDISMKMAICLRTAIEATQGNMQAVKEVREVTEGLLTQNHNLNGNIDNKVNGKILIEFVKGKK